SFERQQTGPTSGAHGGGAGYITKQGDLAEGLAIALDPSQRPLLDHLHLAVADQIEEVAALSLGDDLDAGRDLEWGQVVAEALEGVDGERFEDARLTQQRVAARVDGGACLERVQRPPTED